MVRFDGLLIAGLIGVAVLALPASAQSGSGSSSLTHVVSVIVPSRVKVRVNPLSMSPRNVAAAVKVAASRAAIDGLALTVNANQAWVLAIRSASSVDASSRSRLHWSTSAGGQFIAVSAADSLLSSGTGSAAPVDTTLVFRDGAKPGAFGAAGQAVVLTVSAP